VKSPESNDSHGSFVHEVQLVHKEAEIMKASVVRVGTLKDDIVKVRGTALTPGDQRDHLKQKHPLKCPNAVLSMLR
jgi:hypothetical protein